MLTLLKECFYSFSLRAGVLIFLVLCGFLLALRLHIYRESIDASYKEIRTLIEAHSESVRQAAEDNETYYARDLVTDILHDKHDRRLYMALLYKGKVVAGNLHHWPLPQQRESEGWRELTVVRSNSSPLHLLVKVSRIHHVTLLTGYDLSFVDSLRKTLVDVLLVNILISFALSLVLSIGIMWLVSTELRRVNRTCGAVMQGQLARRVHLRGSHDQFDQLGNNVNRMLDWITALLDSAQESGQALAHDLRTPLSRHRLELQSIAELPNVSRQVREAIFQAVTRIDTLVEMFDNLLTISRAQSQEGRDLFEAFDLCALVRDVAEFYEDLFEDAGMTLALTLPPEVIMVCGDKQLLGQAVMNLVDNAATYCPSGSRVEISLEQYKDVEKMSCETVIVVADNGSGVPEEYREKVKERFYRMEKSRHGKGTGLGLSLVNATAILHHGSLSLEDNTPGLRAVLTLHTQAL